ncbi:MAG: response regulator [bacterium]
MARLLLVEDEPAQLDFYRGLLESEGHDIRQATSGREAIAAAKDFGPAVVVIDLVLPDMHGTEAISRILSECQKAKIVINTNYGHYKMDFRCWNADAFVVKSSDPGDLVRAVRDVLALNRQN